MENQATQYSLELKRFFAAPRERVYRAWTQPQELKKWWRAGEGWSTPIAKVDLRAGGEFLFVTQPPDAKTEHRVKGTYREIIPNKKLVYTFVVEGTESKGQELVTVEFIDQDGGTAVHLTHEFIPRKEESDSRQTAWNVVLNNLANTL